MPSASGLVNRAQTFLTRLAHSIPPTTDSKIQDRPLPASRSRKLHPTAPRSPPLPPRSLPPPRRSKEGREMPTTSYAIPPFDRYLFCSQISSITAGLERLAELVDNADMARKSTLRRSFRHASTLPRLLALGSTRIQKYPSRSSDVMARTMPHLWPDRMREQSPPELCHSKRRLDRRLICKPLLRLTRQPRARQVARRFAPKRQNQAGITHLQSQGLVRKHLDEEAR